MTAASKDKVATLGCGVIGASWAALFLAGGYKVSAYDPVAGAEQQLIDGVKRVWPTLQSLGYTQSLDLSRLSFCNKAAEAVSQAFFVQESIPEQLELKHQLFTEIEPHLCTDAVVASSASGLMLKEMQGGFKNPSRLILGHPFNPPHLIPLVELLGNEQTDPDVLPLAEAFYQSAGKVTIRVNKEVPAHVANRLQAALWREAISLVVEGVASVEDVDKAVWAGPGLRWAAMGPHQLFHLGAGEGGMAEFCNRYANSFHRWWDDLGSVVLDEETVAKLVGGLTDRTDGATHQNEAALRDQLITGYLQASRGLRV